MVCQETLREVKPLFPVQILRERFKSDGESLLLISREVTRSFGNSSHTLHRVLQMLIHWSS